MAEKIPHLVSMKASKVRPRPRSWFGSAYNASKAAVNAFTECFALELELEPLGIRMRLVLPGQSHNTNFAGAAQAKVKQARGAPEAQRPLAERFFAAMREAPETGGRTEEARYSVRRQLCPLCRSCNAAGAGDYD